MENEQRIEILAAHLEIDLYDIKNSYEKYSFRVSPRMTKSGDSPEKYKRLAADLREKLEEIAVVGGPGLQTWQEIIGHLTEDYNAFMQEKTSQAFKDGRSFIYNDLYHSPGNFVYSQFQGYMAAFDEFETMHKYQNALYHLLTGDPADYHVQAIRSGFNGEKIEDTRESHETDSGEYMVLTDSEADQKAKEYIESSLWAFNSSFLANQTDLPEEVFSGLSEKCEDGNGAILKLVNQSCGLDSLVEDAISADSRGHFMNSYDGEETEIFSEDLQDWIYIYRTN